MRFAVVGSGISGLVVAHLLHPGHDITVFEANAYPGGHTNTIRVDTPNETHQVDTGFIVFNDRNYPHFERLLERLAVSGQPSTMSVTDGAGDFEYSSASPNGLFANRAHLLAPRFHRMVADLARFNRAARAARRSCSRSLSRRLAGAPSLLPDVHRAADRPPGLGRVVGRPWPDVVVSRALPGRVLRQPRHALVPGPASLADGPRGIRALRRGAHAPFRGKATARNARRCRYAPRRPRARRAPRRRGGAVRRGRAGDPSDQALALLRDAADCEHEILGAIPYQPNEAVLHTDVRLLPRRRRAWASWNYHLLPEPTQATTVTYHMNRLQSLQAEREFCVTLNRTEEIDPAQVIRTIPYAHPVYTAAGVRAQARVDEISGRNRTHFCGAYWGLGVHEDGVVSGLRIDKRFGAQL